MMVLYLPKGEIDFEGAFELQLIISLYTVLYEYQIRYLLSKSS